MWQGPCNYYWDISFILLYGSNVNRAHEFFCEILNFFLFSNRNFQLKHLCPLLIKPPLGNWTQDLMAQIFNDVDVTLVPLLNKRQKVLSSLFRPRDFQRMWREEVKNKKKEEWRDGERTEERQPLSLSALQAATFVFSPLKNNPTNSRFWIFRPKPGILDQISEFQPKWS